MSKTNRNLTLVESIKKLPNPIANKLLTFIVRKSVKLLDTTHTRVISWDQKHCQVALKNRKCVQNHIGSVHAAAQVMLCETATGLLLSLHLPNDVIQVVKNIEIDFCKKANGNLIAIATLNGDEISMIQESAEGELIVPVKLYDQDENSPVDCQITWAWRKKQKA